VAISAIGSDGLITLAADTPFTVRDHVGALPDRTSLLLLKTASGTTLTSATPLGDVKANDELERVTFTATAVAEHVGGVTLTLPGAADIRAGDVIGKIAGWAQASDYQAASVREVDAALVTLYGPLDGVLPRDTLGLTTLRTGTAWPLRVDKLPDVRPGDDVLLATFDRLRGQSATVSGTVFWVDHQGSHVVVYSPELAQGAQLRPEDIVVSTLFLRGSALALIAKQNLFVTWLGSADAEPMPRACELAAVAPAPCCDDEES
jgi:hypothetical protein